MTEETITLDFRGLSHLEREIVCLIVQGLRNDEIARRQGRTKKAIQNAVARIYEKVGVAKYPDRHPRTLITLAVAARFWKNGNHQEESI